MTPITAPTPPMVLADGEGEAIALRGARILVRAASPLLTVVDYTAPAGFPGPPLHVHPGFDELFLVLEGTLHLRVGDDAVEVGPGGSAAVAGTTRHTFANPTDDPVRFIAACGPGGFEDYFRALAAGDQAAADAVLARFGYATA